MPPITEYDIMQRRLSRYEELFRAGMCTEDEMRESQALVSRVKIRMEVGPVLPEQAADEAEQAPRPWFKPSGLIHEVLPWEDLDQVSQIRGLLSTGLREKLWAGPGPWNQGTTYYCVPYTYDHIMEGSPRPHAWPYSTHAEYFNQCDLNDGVNSSKGTLSSTAAELAKRRNCLVGYSWATNALGGIDWCINNGPVALNGDWTAKWDAGVVDSEQYILSGTNYAYGHCIKVRGGNLDKVHNRTGTKGAARVINSYGAGWGASGEAWFRILDIQRMMDGVFGGHTGFICKPVKV